MSERIEKLKELLTIADDGLTRDEFLEAFQKVIDHILRTEAKIINKVNLQLDKEREKLDKLIADVEKESNNTFGGIRQRMKEAVNRLFAHNEVKSKLKEKLSTVDDKLAELSDKMLIIRDGIDGKDGKDGKPGKDGESYNPTDIEQLRVDLERTKRLRGGGTSAIGVAQTFKYIAHTEQPSGTIDGANATFTTTKNIFWIAGFTINNQQIAELPNFTYAGKTITFDLPIPASYAGKDFEIKYIGS